MVACLTFEIGVCLSLELGKRNINLCPLWSYNPQQQKEKEKEKFTSATNSGTLVMYTMFHVKVIWWKSMWYASRFISLLFGRDLHVALAVDNWIVDEMKKKIVVVVVVL